MKRYSKLIKLGYDVKDIGKHEKGFERVHKDIWENYKFEDSMKNWKSIEMPEEDKINILRRGNFKLYEVMNAGKIQGKPMSQEAKNALLNILNCDVKENFRRVSLTTREFECDAIDELFLFAALEEKRTIPITYNMGKKYEIDEMVDKANETLKNQKKSAEEPPFELPKRINHKSEIDRVGSGIVLTWLTSAPFRNLFQSNRKHELNLNKKDVFNEKSISTILSQGGMLFINQNKKKEELTDDEIIGEEIETILLEKMLGLNTIISYRKYIAPFVTDFSVKDFDVVKSLMEIIMSFEGCFERSELIRVIGIKLSILSTPSTDVSFRKTLLSLYKTYLDDVIGEMKKDYDELLKAYASGALQSVKKEEWVSNFCRARLSLHYGICRHEGTIPIYPKYFIGINGLSTYENDVVENEKTTKIIVDTVIKCSLKSGMPKI